VGQADGVAHRDHPQVPLPGSLGHDRVVDADPVVGHGGPQNVFLALEDDFHPGRPGVLAHVLQGFLDGPVDEHLEVDGEPGAVQAVLDLDREVPVAGRPVGEFVHGRAEPDRLEGRWVELGRDRPGLVDEDAEVPAEAVEGR
jgi:hypothetical protein